MKQWFTNNILEWLRFKLDFSIGNLGVMLQFRQYDACSMETTFVAAAIYLQWNTLGFIWHTRYKYSIVTLHYLFGSKHLYFNRKL